jgi:hypothetical protein
MRNLERNYYHVIILLVAFFASAGLIIKGINSGINIPSAFASTTCPTSGNNVTISTNCNFDPGNYYFTGTLTIEAAAYAGPGGAILGAVNLYADNITIPVGGNLNAMYRGYSPTYPGPGSGGNGTAAGGGGGHGGAGGAGTKNGVVDGAAGAAYDSWSNPTDVGSNGGNAGGTVTIGLGGGYISLNATSVVTINGSFNANGRSNSAPTGSGAGGTLVVVADTLNGNGTITAAGGNSTAVGSNIGGDGGGGIIVFRVNHNNFSGTTSVAGGGGTGNPGNPGVVNATMLSSVSPSGGSIYGGASQNISWSASGSGIHHYQIQLSANGNYTSWPTTIISSTGASPYTGWTVPNTAGTYKIKVNAYDASNNMLASAVSASAFTIINFLAPTTPGHTNQTSSSMRWTWANGDGATVNYAYGTTNACATGTATNTYWDESSLSSNTAYTRYVCGRNSGGALSSPLTIGPFYTSADTPVSPGYNTVTSTGMNMTWSSGGAQSSFILSSSDCSVSGGSTSTSPQTISGQSANTAITRYVCAVNGNGDRTSALQIGPFYTAANTPTTASHSLQTASGMNLSWASGGAQSSYIFSASDCSSGGGSTATSPQTISGLTANTSVTRYVCATNADGVRTPALTVGPFFTDASVPTSPASDSVTTSGMNLSWASGGAQTSFYYGTVADCGSGGSVVTSPQTVSGLTANTAVTRYVCAVNGSGDKTSALTIGPFYTLATTPGAPAITNLTSTTMDVNPAAITGGGEMAIYVSNSAVNCSAATGGNYVQTGGSLSSSAAWQTESAWGTKTVTGLSPGTTYYTCVKARNSSNAETAFGTSATGTTVNPPVLTSVTIADTGGYTADATPSITLAYTGGTPTTMKFSCDNTNWSTPITYASPTSGFNITNGATNCTTANGSKTIYAEIINAGGTSSSQNYTTYYDTTGPTVSSFSANNIATTQIQMSITASDSGSGLAASPYIYYESSGAACSHTNNSGYISTNPYTWGSLSANTQYSFDVKARDILLNISAYSTCQTLYTSASTPGAPVVNSPTMNSLNVNPAAITGGGEMAIYVSNSAANCSSATGGGYVQTDGSLSSNAAWQTEPAWGTKTVTGLNSNITYYTCVKARNGDNAETAFGTSASGTTNAALPSMTSISIANTSGFTNDATPLITLVYSGTTAAYMSFSCDGGINWSSDIAYASPTGAFNITNGATGCDTASGTKTITARVKSVDGYSANNASDTIYYDKAGPAISSFTAVNTSLPGQVQLSVTADDGLGIGVHATTPYYYTESPGATCLNTNNTGWIPNNPYTWSGFGYNTQRSFNVRARDQFSNQGGISACVTLYTSAAKPITAGNDSQTASGMNLTWASGGANSGYYFSDTDCSSGGGVLASSPQAISGLTANTEVTRYVCAVNADGDRTAALQIGPFYTDADVPVSPGYDSLTDTDVNFTWASGGAQSGYYFSSSDCNVRGGTLSTSPKAVTGLTANTAVTRYVCATNGNGDRTAALQIGPIYTLATKPGAPTVNNLTSNTMDINPPAITGGGEMAIYVSNSAANCSAATGGGYVQTDGSLSSSAAWQTEPAWGTKTVTGLNTGAPYYACVKARNGNNVETAFGASVSGSIIITPSLTSMVISDKGGYTNDSTPYITLVYSGGAPTTMQFSCDGINWSNPVTYASPTSVFNMTNGATGCATASGLKTIYAQIINSGGASSPMSDTTYYDKTGPSVSSFTADNISASQIRMTIGGADDGDGIGLHTTSPYYYARTPGGSCAHTSSTLYSAWILNDPYIWGGLSSNTQYSFDAKARDKFGNQGNYSACQTFYTSAKTPSAPKLSNSRAGSVDADPVSGGTSVQKDMAIYAASGLAANCDGTNGIGYVQADGTIGSTPVWQTDAAWGTKTVTGLSGGTNYYFCSQARNTEDDVTAFGKTAYVAMSKTNPAPLLSSLSPASVIGSFHDDTVSGFTLTVNGSNFVNGSVVRWDGDDRVTSYVSPTQLTAAILSSDLDTYGPVSITVFSPLPAGGISGQQIFTVIDPLPIATHFSPEHGSTDFEAENSLLHVQEVMLANPAGSIEWQGPVTVKSQNFDSNVKVGEGYVSINKASLDSSLDSTARISMHVLDCASYKIYYSLGFKNILEDVKSAGHECGAATSPACTNAICNNNILTFDVPHFDSYGSQGFVASDSKGIPTTLAIPNAVPVITAGPSDGGSSSATPTNEGSDVHFTATATDGNTDGYFLKICKTDSITPNVYAPPDCANGQQICTSAEAASGSQASCDFNTLGFIGESQDWYAFVCDYNADPLCSPVSQGTGDSGSPFSVNHAGTFGTVTVTNTSDKEIAPGDTLKFTLPSSQIADSDTGGSQNFLTMHICTPETTSYNYVTDTCTGGTSVCSSTAVDPISADAVCTGGASLVSVPTAHGNYGFKVYVEDTHSFPAVGNNSQTYSVTDVPPQVMSYTGPNAPAPSAGGSDDITFSVTVHDDNGDNDITAVNGVFYNTAGTGLDSGICISSENNCYLAPSCVTSGVSIPGSGKTALGSDNELTASCTVTVWFNADYSEGWKAHANISDATHDITDSADSGAVSNPALLGINVTEAGIVYGTVTIGGTSAAKETSMGNMGNQTLDVYVNGTPMTSGSYSIPVSQQKWYQTSDPFDWDAVPADEGPFSLVETPSGTTDGGGCLNRDIQVRPVHDSLSTNESIYWKLRIPANQHAGSYSGQNTFSTTSGDTCTGAEF